MPAIETYRSRFQPSAQLSEPYVMVGLNVFAADTAPEARLLRTSAQQSILRLRRGEPGPLPPPVNGFEEGLSPAERQVLDQVQSCSVVGSAETVGIGIEAFVERTGADEVMIAAPHLRSSRAPSLATDHRGAADARARAGHQPAMI